MRGAFDEAGQCLSFLHTRSHTPPQGFVRLSLAKLDTEAFDLNGGVMFVGSDSEKSQ
jgi:hypothetical protein